MKTFADDTASGTLLRAGRRTISMGLRQPKIRAIVEKFNVTQQALKASMDIVNAAEDLVIDAEAGVDLEAALGVETIEELQYDIEKAIKKNYQDPLYTAVFPKGLAAFKAQSGEALFVALPNVILALEESGAAKLTAHVPKIKEHVKAVTKPLAQLHSARRSAGTVATRHARARTAWLDGYTALYGSFITAFPRRKRFVDSFFPKTAGSKSRGKKKDESKQAPTTPGTSAGAGPKARE